MSIICEERTFDSTSGTDKVRYLKWSDDAVAPKAIAIIVHGVCEHIDRFDDLAKSLVAAGYVCYGEDHVGHGKTAAGLNEENLRNIGKCPKNADKIVVKDVHKLRDIAVSENPGLPEVVIGHSMGSFISKIYATKYGKELSALVLCGSGDFFGSPFRLLINPLKPIFYADGFKDFEVKVSNTVSTLAWLSRDVENRKIYLKDELITKYYTPGLMAMLGGLAATSAGTLWAKDMPKDLPVFVVAGTQDIVGFCTIGVKAANMWMDCVGIEDHATKYYKGYRHELFRDECKEDVFADIKNWLTTKGLPG